jgi:hypothetical protein
MPPYTSKAQNYFYQVSGIIKRISDDVAKPIFFIEGLFARIKAFFGR